MQKCLDAKVLTFIQTSCVCACVSYAYMRADTVQNVKCERRLFVHRTYS